MDLFPWDKTDPSWHPILKDIFRLPELKKTEKLVVEEYERGTVYPPKELIFNAFIQTPFDDIKVVIIGQDPYHGEGQAHGLCFSVPRGIPHPPSLKNILEEIRREYGMKIPSSGDLTPWAHQGVFLLNAILTVRAGQPESHKHIGWESFTNMVIQKISERKKDVVFMLWGSYARNKKSIIDAGKHYILEAGHPSPYSASNFLGCYHFWKTNEHLISRGIKPINWAIE